MEHKVRTMIAFLLLGLPLAMMFFLISSQPDITAQVVANATTNHNADSLLFWKIIIVAMIVVVAFFLYEKATKFQSRLQKRLACWSDVVPLFVRFGLAIALIVMVSRGFFAHAGINVVFISYLTVAIAVLLLFGLFTHFAAFIGLLVFIYSITQHGFTLFNDLSILGGLVYLLYLKYHKYSFDGMLTKKLVAVDLNPPLTVLRIFQGISLIILYFVAGYPLIIVLLGVMIILGFMLRLAEFAVIVTFIVNVLYYNVDATISMVLFSALALFIAGYTKHSLDYLIFEHHAPRVSVTPQKPVSVRKTPAKKKKVAKKKTRARK